MRSCGKRLFTQACKAPRPRIGAEERGFKNGRFGGCRAAHFFARGGRAFFQGGLRKTVFWSGDFVVKVRWIAW